MKKTLQLMGLDCANCAAELERKIAKTEGVQSATLTFVTQRLTVEVDSDEVLSRVIDIVNHFEEVRVVEKSDGAGRALDEKHEPHEHSHEHEHCSCGCCHEHHEHNHEHHEHHVHNHDEEHTHEHMHEHTHEHAKKGGAHTKEWFAIGVSAIFFIAATLLQNVFGGLAARVAGYICYAVAYVAVGYPVLLATFKNVRKGRIFDENFLMTIASVGAVCIGEVGEGVLVMLLYQLGELLQAIAVGSSRRSVTELMSLKSEWANLLKDGKQCRVTPEELRIGDVVAIKAGEKIPVDGVLLSDEATLDTKSLTGEAALQRGNKGAELLSGCITAGGVCEMRVTRLYDDSAVGKILEMVETAAEGKAKPEKFITKFARIYTPVVCCLALAIALFVPLCSGLMADGRLYFRDFGRWAQSALTFLVISCPCALIISVPLSYFSGIGTCAKNGILVKGATYLDVVAQAKIVAFDKTGTLTEGNFTVCKVNPAENVSEEDLLNIASAVEYGSAHPIAKAFENVPTTYVAEEIVEVSGRGVRAKINGEKVLVGTERFLRENGVGVFVADSIYTQIYVAKAGCFLGSIEIGDRVRREAKSTICELRKLGIERNVMLTGDQEKRAYKIANEVVMYEVNAKLLPDQKLQRAEELKIEGGLIYVGDGVNDAPVMATADCAVSMGKLGSAAAVEASDMVLISDNLRAIPKSIRIARKTRRIVTQNIVFSLAMKALFMILGLCGVLPLWLAVFADVGVMLIAVCNSFRVRFFKT